jgi:hypothetical protein
LKSALSYLPLKSVTVLNVLASSSPRGRQHGEQPTNTRNYKTCHFAWGLRTRLVDVRA